MTSIDSGTTSRATRVIETSEPGREFREAYLTQPQSYGDPSRQHSVLRWGYNCQPAGGPVLPNEHVGSFVVESYWNAPDGKPQLETYFEYLTPDALTKVRPWAANCRIEDGHTEFAINCDNFEMNDRRSQRNHLRWRVGLNRFDFNELVQFNKGVGIDADLTVTGPVHVQDTLHAGEIRAAGVIGAGHSYLTVPGRFGVIVQPPHVGLFLLAVEFGGEGIGGLYLVTQLERTSIKTITEHHEKVTVAAGGGILLYNNTEEDISGNYGFFPIANRA